MRNYCNNIGIKLKQTHIFYYYYYLRKYFVLNAIERRIERTRWSFNKVVVQNQNYKLTVLIIKTTSINRIISCFSLVTQRFYLVPIV